MVKATTVLHNYLQKENGQRGGNGTQGDDHGAQGLAEINLGGNHHAVDAFDVRENFKEFFVAEGAVPWQGEMINRGRNDN